MGDEEKDINQDKNNGRKNVGLKPNLPLIIIVLLAFFLIIFLITHGTQYKLGYIYKGPILNYNRFQLEKYIFELGNGNILFLGRNVPVDNEYSECKDCVDAKYIPNEIYNPKTNKIENILFPSNIYYQGNAILLNNNKLLLTQAYEFNNIEYKEGRAYPFDSIIVINLNNMTIEKIIKKELNRIYKPYPNQSVLLLDNSNILISHENKFEIVDIENNTSKILDIDFPSQFGSIIPIKNQKILFFEQNHNINKDDFYLIYEYDYNNNNKKMSIVGKRIKRDSVFIKKINEDKIIILGGNNPTQYFDRNNEVEIYDINTHKTQVISKMIIDRCPSGKNGFDIALFANRYLFMIGGLCSINPIFGIKTDKKASVQSEIIDLNTYKHTLGPKISYLQKKENLQTLSNGNVLIIGRNKVPIQIFKQWR